MYLPAGRQAYFKKGEMWRADLKPTIKILKADGASKIKFSQAHSSVSLQFITKKGKHQKLYLSSRRYSASLYTTLFFSLNEPKRSSRDITFIKNVRVTKRDSLPHAHIVNAGFILMLVLQKHNN